MRALHRPPKLSEVRVGSLIQHPFYLWRALHRASADQPNPARLAGHPDQWPELTPNARPIHRVARRGAVDAGEGWPGRLVLDSIHLFPTPPLRMRHQRGWSNYLVFAGCFFGVAAVAPVFEGGCGACAGCCDGVARSATVRIASTCFWMSARARS